MILAFPILPRVSAKYVSSRSLLVPRCAGCSEFSIEAEYSPCRSKFFNGSIFDALAFESTDYVPRVLDLRYSCQKLLEEIMVEQGGFLVSEHIEIQFSSFYKVNDDDGISK